MPDWATPMIMPPIRLIEVMRMPATASPRTNLLAPSMAPKKLDWPSSSLRRSLASCSVMSPAERSASIAICLPGMASRVKRAATSAIRPEPLVITTKFTITRMMNTMMPMTKLPCITKLPKASMMSPAASVPDDPCDRIRRVEAMLRPSLNMVAIRRIAGKAVNSSGLLMNSAVIRISTEKQIDTASATSSSAFGMGRSSMTRSASTPTPMATSPRSARRPMPARLSPEELEEAGVSAI